MDPLNKSHATMAQASIEGTYSTPYRTVPYSYVYVYVYVRCGSGSSSGARERVACVGRGTSRWIQEIKVRWGKVDTVGRRLQGRLGPRSARCLEVYVCRDFGDRTDLPCRVVSKIIGSFQRLSGGRGPWVRAGRDEDRGPREGLREKLAVGKGCGGLV